jgi:hypothetical protein
MISRRPRPRKPRLWIRPTPAYPMPEPEPDKPDKPDKPKKPKRKAKAPEPEGETNDDNS